MLRGRGSQRAQQSGQSSNRSRSPQGQQQSTNQQQEAVSFGSLLQLSPPHLEADFWKSDAAVRLLHASDLICLSYSVFMYFMLVRTFGWGQGSGLSWHHQLPVLTYFITAVVQLVVFLCKPALHQRYRFQLTVVNRLMRLCTICFAAWNTTSGVMDRMTARVNSEERANPSEWMKLIRPLVGPPLVYLNHANHVLPFAWVLPAQLISLAACVLMIRATTCVLACTPGNLVLSQTMCQALKKGMYYLSLLLGRLPGQGDSAYAQECQGVQGLLLLELFVHAVLLLVLPCLVVYFVELNLKVSFVQLRQLRLKQTWPMMDSTLIKVIVVYAAVVGCWFSCELVVLGVSPVECNGNGLLAMVENKG